MSIRLLGAAFAGAIAVAALAVPAGAADVTLRLQHFLAPTAPAQKILHEPWAEWVKTASKGRIETQIYPAMQLGGAPPQLADQVREGIADVVWTLPGYTPGRFPRVEVFELPFMHINALATTLALQDYAEMHLAEEFKDFKVILFHVHDGQLLQANRGVEKLEDFKGMKIRVPNRVGGWMIEAIGAVPVGAPVPQVPQMLSKGVVDGTMLPLEVALPLKLHELVKFNTVMAGPQPRFNTSVFSLLMNRKRYDDLPPDLKKAIDDYSGRKIAEYAGRKWIEVEAPGREAAEKAGVKFVTMPQAEVDKLKSAVKPVYDRWLAETKAAGIDGDKLLADARRLLEKYKDAK